MLAAALISVFILGCKLKKEPPMWDMLGWARREGAMAEACRARKALLGQMLLHHILMAKQWQVGGEGPPITITETAANDGKEEDIYYKTWAMPQSLRGNILTVIF